jgi:hypothetical protein
MPNFRIPHLRLASLIALCMLTASCGSADPDTLPATGASAGSGSHGNAPASQAATDAAGPAKAGSALGAVQDEDSPDDDDSGWPAPRQIPAGTLTWTVVYKGNGTTQTRDAKEVAVLLRQMHGKAHMIGMAGSQKHVASPLDGINKAMDACGDDMACQQAAAMRAVTRDPDAIRRGLQKAQAESRRDTTWAAESCSADGKADDTATWSGMTENGFNTGTATRRGTQSIVDCTVQLEEGDTRPRLVTDDASKTYELALPPAEIRVTGTLAGKTEPVPRVVRFPPVLVRGVKYTSLEGPLSGSVVVKSGAGRGIWSEGWTIPLTEQVTWTFTPDAK